MTRALSVASVPVQVNLHRDVVLVIVTAVIAVVAPQVSVIFTARTAVPPVPAFGRVMLFGLPDPATRVNQVSPVSM